jgi:RHS repeat-associated protein
MRGQVTAAAYGQANVAAASGEPPPPGVDANSTSGRDEPGSSTFTPSQTFAYDAAGNRLEVTDNGMTTKYQPNAANQYEQIVTGTEIVEPQFDPLGNLLQDDRNTYTWDSDIHLLSVSTKGAQVQGKSSLTTASNSQQSSTVSFRYDALHRRVVRLENQSELTLFTHDGWNVIQEQSVNLKLKTLNLKRSARHTWGEDLSGTLQGAGGIGGLLATIHNVSQTKNLEEGITNWFHYDSNGNVILLTDKFAAAAGSYTYDAFGHLIAGEGILAKLNKYLYSTKYFESGFCLNYFGYRYYNARTGRWLSKDPSQEFGGLNLYSLIRNNAVNKLDMLGLFDLDDCLADCLEQYVENVETIATVEAVVLVGCGILAVIPGGQPAAVAIGNASLEVYGVAFGLLTIQLSGCYAMCSLAKIMEQLEDDPIVYW